MKRFFLTAAILMALSASSFAQAGSIEQQIRDLDKQHREAAIRGDASFEERVTTSDYVGITASGALSSREQAAARLRSGDVKLQAIDVDEEKVRVYGDTAVVTGRVHVVGTFKGQ